MIEAMGYSIGDNIATIASIKATKQNITQYTSLIVSLSLSLSFIFDALNCEIFWMNRLKF